MHEQPLPQCEMIHKAFDEHKKESVPIRDSVKRMEIVLEGVSEETKEIFNRLNKQQFDSTAALVLAKSVDERVTRHNNENEAEKEKQNTAIDKLADLVNKAMFGTDKEKGLFSRVKDVEDVLATQKKQQNWWEDKLVDLALKLIFAALLVWLGLKT